MVMAAHALLQHKPAPSRPDIQRALAGHMCRCTGYVKIIEAIEAAGGGR
jgi:aerobic-type carbon monoxide dehydrogenase small subunit (CoxS/CutS family)